MLLVFLAANNAIMYVRFTVFLVKAVGLTTFLVGRYCSRIVWDFPKTFIFIFSFFPYFLQEDPFVESQPFFNAVRTGTTVYYICYPSSCRKGVFFLSSFKCVRCAP